MKIAFFGTGLLGGPMAMHLLQEGHTLVVYNRTRRKTAALEMKGAKAVARPEEAMEQADIFITMLTDYLAIEAVILSENPRKFKGKTWFQMSTISPVESLLLKHQFEEAGGEYIEAPVLGSTPQVAAKALIILFGGMEPQYKKWAGFLRVFGEKVIRMGNVGQASAAKLALNQLIASLTSAFSLSLGYCRERGVNIRRFMEILRSSALYASTFDKKLERMIKRDYTNPNFPVKHMLKDVELMLTEFSVKGLDTSHLEGVKKVLLKAIDNGDAEMDYSALYNAIHPIS